MTVSLIGLHMRTNGIKEYPTRVVLSLNGNGLNEQHEDTITVFRTTRVFNERPSDLYTHPLATTIEYARYWYSERTDGPTLRNEFLNNPANYYQITNEASGNNPDEFQKLIAFERNICILMVEDNLKAIVGSLAGDTPSLSDWLKYYVPFIKESWQKYGALYGRHVYGGPYLMENGIPTTTPPGNPQRPFDELQELVNQGHKGGYILTECGLNGGYGVQPYDVFKDQILSYTQLFEKYASIFVGLCFWETGNSEFGANYTEHLKKIEPELNKSFDRWSPEVPTGVKTVSFKIGQEHTRDEWRQLAGIAYDNYKRSMTASTDACVNEVALGNEESYAIVVDPDLPSQVETINALEELSLRWEPFYFRTVDPPTDYIDVQPLSQNDPRWKYKVIGQTTGHGKTIGSWGCLLTVYNMLARHWGLTNRLPDEENDYYLSKNLFNDQYIVSMAMSQAYDQVEDEGWLNNSPQMHEKTRFYLEQGIPVSARVDFHPNTPRWDQHWVLLVGYDPEKDDYLINDPWNGNKAVWLKDFYDIEGSDVLECIYYYVDIGEKLDLINYLKGDGRLYEVRNNEGGQERHQTQDKGNGVFWQTKNVNAEYLFLQNGYIWRDWDTSPGNNRYYRQQRERGTNGSKWLPDRMAVGETFSVSLWVQFYHWDCSESAPNSGAATDTFRLIAHYPTWTSRAGITLNDVIQIEWVNGGEIYFYARNFGLVGWERKHQDPNTPEWSAISEIHAPGTRPDNVVNLPTCL